jgi:hypothetical protein
MTFICPGSTGYPSKPSQTAFATSYGTNASTAATSIGVSVAFVLCQWFQEWGIPINNPAFQTSTFSHPTNPSPSACGSFPIFATLADGVGAYTDQIKYSYCGGVNAHANIFGDPTNVSDAYLNGFPASKTHSAVPCDGGGTANVTSVHFAGQGTVGGNKTTGTYAANEMIGASPWDAGHYMSSSDTYTGYKLNVILNGDLAWASL